MPYGTWWWPGFAILRLHIPVPSPSYLTATYCILPPTPYCWCSEFPLKGRAVCWLTLNYSWLVGFQPNPCLQVLRAFWTLCLLLSNPVAMFSTLLSVPCTYVEKATLPTWKKRNIMLLLLHLNERYSQETTFLRSFFFFCIQGYLGSWSEKCLQIYISVWLHLLTI